MLFIFIKLPKSKKKKMILAFSFIVEIVIFCFSSIISYFFIHHQLTSQMIAHQKWAIFSPISIRKNLFSSLIWSNVGRRKWWIDRNERKKSLLWGEMRLLRESAIQCQVSIEIHTLPLSFLSPLTFFRLFIQHWYNIFYRFSFFICLQCEKCMHESIIPSVRFLFFSLALFFFTCIGWVNTSTRNLI